MTNWEQVLFKALASPLGLLLRAAEPEKVRQKLYAVRRTMDGAQSLQFRIVDHAEGNLAITKGAGPQELGL